MKTAGSQTVTAADTASSSLAGASGAVTRERRGGHALRGRRPSRRHGGQPLTFTVTAEDPYNNTATGYAGTVHFTSSDPAAVLPANATLTSGTGTFSVTLKTAGSQTLTATDTANGSLTGTSSAVNVSAGGGHALRGQRSRHRHGGHAFTFTVTAEDPYNNTATGYTGTVHFTSSDPPAVLPANATLTNGVRAPSASRLKTAGSQTLTATDTVNGSITGSSGPVTVSAGGGHAFRGQRPPATTAGSALTFTVTAEDPYGNTATGYAGTVHFTSSDPAAVLPANATLTRRGRHVQRHAEDGGQPDGDRHRHRQRRDHRQPAAQ